MEPTKMFDWRVFCERERLFWEPPRRDWSHQVLTFLTLGLWEFIWAAVRIDWRWKEPWRCCIWVIACANGR